MGNALRLWCGLVYAVALCSCARLDPRWRLVEDSLPVADNIRSHVCEVLRERTGQLNSLRLLSNVDLKSSEGVQNLRLTIAYQSPNKVRLEVLPPGAAMALFLASSNGAETLILDPSKKSALRVEDPAQMIAKLLRVAIPPSDLVYVLSARIPPKDLDRICAVSDQKETARFVFPPDGDGVTIVDESAGQFWTVAVESGLLRTALLRKGRRGGPVLVADFPQDDFPDLQQLFPHKIDLILGNDLVQAELEPTIVKLNSTIPEGVFRISIPPGYSIDN